MVTDVIKYAHSVLLSNQSPSTLLCILERCQVHPFSTRKCTYKFREWKELADEFALLHIRICIHLQNKFAQLAPHLACSKSGLKLWIGCLNGSEIRPQMFKYLPRKQDSNE